MPDTYIRKPVEVKAVQFHDWLSAIEIFDWIPKIFYVPEGHNHPLRNKPEYNHSSDEVFKSATAFLVLNTSKGNLRINPGSWIVRLPEGRIQVFTNDEFRKYFDDLMEVEND